MALNLNSDPFKIAELMEDFRAPWGFCGGWAIDLFIGTNTRPHKDIDIAVLRRHQKDVYRHLMDRGWTLEKAQDGKLTPLAPNEFVELPVHGIWCKNIGFEPDFLEILLNEADKDYFYFRRDFSVTLEINKVFIQTPAGLPILTPEIVLLYKSNDYGQENEADFQNVRPFLNEIQKNWLKSALHKIYAAHPWQTRL